MPQPISTRLHPIAALRAMRNLKRNREDTRQAVLLIDALRGKTSLRQFARFRQTETGRTVLAERRQLIDRLSDRGRLAALPPGTLGRSYHEFMAAENLTAEGWSKPRKFAKPCRRGRLHPVPRAQSRNPRFAAYRHRLRPRPARRGMPARVLVRADRAEGIRGDRDRRRTTDLPAASRPAGAAGGVRRLSPRAAGGVAVRRRLGEPVGRAGRGDQGAISHQPAFLLSESAGGDARHASGESAHAPVAA